MMLLGLITTQVGLSNIRTYIFPTYKRCSAWSSVHTSPLNLMGGPKQTGNEASDENPLQKKIAVYLCPCDPAIPVAFASPTPNPSLPPAVPNGHRPLLEFRIDAYPRA
jgi:hypothetical protein